MKSLSRYCRSMQSSLDKSLIASSTFRNAPTALTQVLNQVSNNLVPSSPLPSHPFPSQIILSRLLLSILSLSNLFLNNMLLSRTRHRTLCSLFHSNLYLVLSTYNKELPTSILTDPHHSSLIGRFRRTLPRVVLRLCRRHPMGSHISSQQIYLTA
jgi:hypothetical protein